APGLHRKSELGGCSRSVPDGISYLAARKASLRKGPPKGCIASSAKLPPLYFRRFAYRQVISLRRLVHPQNSITFHIVQDLNDSARPMNLDFTSGRVPAGSGLQWFVFGKNKRECSPLGVFLGFLEIKIF